MSVLLAQMQNPKLAAIALICMQGHKQLPQAFAEIIHITLKLSIHFSDWQLPPKYSFCMQSCVTISWVEPTFVVHLAIKCHTFGPHKQEL
jgi:hypothetical protein